VLPEVLPERMQPRDAVHGSHEEGQRQPGIEADPRLQQEKDGGRPPRPPRGARAEERSSPDAGEEDREQRRERERARLVDRPEEAEPQDLEAEGDEAGEGVDERPEGGGPG